ncbi:MAG: hypothetical protein GY952_09780 [Rhodobacteraceae bacterium]|nr:hypothetical protein [Paracoccaceae bacterium]
MRTFLMVFSILIMVFSGGCSLYFLLGGMGPYISFVFVLGGIPFVVGLVIFLLARRMQKKT